MKVLVFGATGGTGRFLIEGSLDAGHTVTAFVREPVGRVVARNKLRVVRGNVLDAASVDAAVAGQDEVLSALGSTTRHPEPVLSEGMRYVLNAMERHRVRRIVVLSAAGALREPAGFLIGNLAVRVARMWLPEVYREHRKMLDALKARDLDWTAVRAPVLTNGSRKGHYRVILEGIPHWGFRISREDVADFMVRQLSLDEFVRKMPAIAY